MKRTHTSGGILQNIPQFNKDKRKDVNVWLVGLGNTRGITTNEAHKISPNIGLSLKVNRLKFKTAWKLPTILEESVEYTPILWRKTEDVNM